MKKYLSFLLFVFLLTSYANANEIIFFNSDTTLTKSIKNKVSQAHVQYSIDPKFRNFKLIAHRGGICENLYEEYDPRSIKAAIDSGYWMLEIDVRATKDSILIVNHHDDLGVTYGLKNQISKMTFDELSKIRALKGNYPPMSFEEVLQLMKKSNTKIMVDLKLEQPIVWFNKSINEMLKKYDMLNDAVFLRNDVINLYEGGTFGFRMSELDRIKKMVSAGIDVSKRYYLFDHGNRINAEAARWCQKNNIMVCASVNFGHYTLEDPTKGAKRDIEHLIQCGLTVFQIDSDFDEFFH
jgi:glycerophosphoryl diester phosphodiesterase